MHPNRVFRQRPDEANLAFARERAFGILSINGTLGPLLAHVPFILNEAGDTALLHLARSNPILRELEQPLPCVIAVSGPDGYVSPDWYGMPDQAPTWNYVAVHLRGQLERLPAEELSAVLDSQSEVFEAWLAPKTPWMPAKMEPDIRARMMRAIVPMRVKIETVDGTWKLSQNKTDEARLGAAQAVESGAGQELNALSALMRALPEDTPPTVDTAPDDA